MTAKDLKPLASLGGLLLDRALADLNAAARSCAESRERIAALDVGPAPGNLPLAAAALAALRYETWADARRAELNLTLARQTAEWISARDLARRAFGRAEAIRELQRRQAKTAGPDR